ncbi:hypothetical protein DSCW_21720 [Desulfosarcina widdelii]|uniref:STAS/SEC14 domain-containing protein n=1 Tax=Desulfosarcina widdelii TaxID=947919 RepID=A0A5K7Z215_9BACT|nr:hypothetical protein [Desulfosarcina widdelii]BBO74755.1 hypothetical protein DSCW_21720 [Desulfosarcina widdelii]
MANFDITIDKALDQTTIRFSGRIIASDIIDALQSFYQTEITTKILWDFLEGDFTDLPSSDLTIIIDAAKSLSDMRPGGKSAFVGSSDLLYGLARMYASLAEVKRHPIANRAFRSNKEALAWLNGID